MYEKYVFYLFSKKRLLPRLGFITLVGLEGKECVGDAKKQ
jgi:hypothetical protein